MHMYARDLEDLSMLVTSRAKDAHVHICKDAQTGLGTVYSVPPAVILALPQLLHIVLKRLLECFITWNIC